MQLVIEKMLTDFERGGMTRRQLALSLAALVTRAQAAPKQDSHPRRRQEFLWN